MYKVLYDISVKKCNLAFQFAKAWYLYSNFLKGIPAYF